MTEQSFNFLRAGDSCSKQPIALFPTAEELTTGEEVPFDPSTDAWLNLRALTLFNK